MVVDFCFFDAESETRTIPVAEEAGESRSSERVPSVRTRF